MINRKVPEYAQTLNLNGDAKAPTLEGLGSRDFLSIEDDPSLSRQKLTTEKLKQRTLASAVWADDAAQLAGVNDKIDAIHRTNTAEVLAQALYLQKRQFCSRQHVIPYLQIAASAS
jgi:hypothetical protein